MTKKNIDYQIKVNEQTSKNANLSKYETFDKDKRKVTLQKIHLKLEKWSNISSKKSSQYQDKEKIYHTEVGVEDIEAQVNGYDIDNTGEDPDI